MGNGIAPFVNDTPEGRKARSQLTKQQVTIVFIDLVGSTAFANELLLEDYEDLSARYTNIVSNAIEHNKGIVRRIHGDGILASFGFPALEQATEHAITACFQTLEELNELNKEFEHLTTSRISARAGIATGIVSSGVEYDTKEFREQPFYGPTTNRAQRLQSIATPGAILISETTKELIGKTHECTNLGQRELKGLGQKETIWRVDRPAKSVSRFQAYRGSTVAPFVGREKEMDTLIKCWSKVLDNDSQVISVVGQAGIGKSRLINEFLGNRCSATPVTIQFQSTRQHSPYFPFKDLLRKALDLSSFDSESDASAKVASFCEKYNFNSQFNKTIRKLIGGSSLNNAGESNLADQEIDHNLVQTILSAAVLSQFEGKAGIFLVEDCHWADQSSADFVKDFTNATHKLSVFTVITARPGYDDTGKPFELFRSREGRKMITTLPLFELEPDKVDEMLESIQQLRGASNRLIDLVKARADGIPLYIEELFETLLQNNVESDPEREIPLKINDLLMVQLDALPYEARQLARISSLVGSNISRGILKSLSDLDEYDFEVNIEALLNSGLMTKEASGNSARYQFKHALVQDAAYASILKDIRKKDLHRKIVTIVEADHPAIIENQPDFLAYHLQQCDQFEQATSYWIKASELARTSSAPVEELHFIDKAIQTLGLQITLAGENRQLLLELMLRKGAVFASQTSYADSELEPLYLKTIEICKSVNSTSVLVESLTGLSAFYYVRGDLDDAMNWAQEAHNVALSAGDSAALVSTHRLLGEILVYLGNFSWSRYHLEKCIYLYQQGDHSDNAIFAGDDAFVLAHMYLALDFWFLGFTDKAFEINEAGRKHAESLEGDFHTFAQAQFYTAWLYGLNRNAELCLSFARKAVELCTSHGLEMFLGTSLILKGWAETTLGVSGKSSLEQGMKKLDTSNAKLTIGSFIIFYSEGFVILGRAKHAECSLFNEIGPQIERDNYLSVERRRYHAYIKRHLLNHIDELSYEHILRELLGVAMASDNKSCGNKVLLDLSELLFAQKRYSELAEFTAEVATEYASWSHVPDDIDKVLKLGASISINTNESSLH